MSLRNVSRKPSVVGFGVGEQARIFSFTDGAALSETVTKVTKTKII